MKGINPSDLADYIFTTYPNLNITEAELTICISDALNDFHS